MTRTIQKLILRVSRVLATLVIVSVAGWAAWLAWQHYVYAPWTRDARVQANVVNVAPNVAGEVEKVAVSNNSFVHKGHLLFKIDPTRFKHAVAERKAQVAKAKAQAAYDQKNAARLAHLPRGAVSTQKVQLARSKARSARASIQTAKAHLAQARQNLAWATVRSPISGYVTHLLLSPGDYVKQGSRSITIVQARSFHVTAYFEETKLAHLAIGDPATIKLMSRNGRFKGHVSNIAYGIAVANNAKGERNLPNVAPKFQWVRLAQRIPVKIVFDHPKKVGRLSVGMTASVHVRTNVPAHASANAGSTPAQTTHQESSP